MELVELLKDTGASLAHGSAKKIDVSSVTQDSRAVQKGSLFVAVPGEKHDGTTYIEEAVKAGAAVVLAEKQVPCAVPLYLVNDARKVLAQLASNFYKRPADDLTLLAITGTNGKTTVSLLLEQMCIAGGWNTGLIGTLNYRYGTKSEPATRTTPDALSLHRMLREAVDAGTEAVVMEVSSHALDQYRVHGLTFRAAAFTNLTRDHLDYHDDLENYFQAKRKLFTENLSSGGVAVVNGDDTNAVRIYSELRGQKRMAWKFSSTGAGEISATNVELTLQGIRAVLKSPAGDIQVKSKLIGMHNLQNILAAAGVALSAGLSRRDVQDGIERVQVVPGRMERIEAGGKTALVDYAHTDDALRNALESVRPLTKGRVFLVFGCGGDRDKGKRPMMGQVAGENADLVIVTSDNPRTEDPEDIIGEITPGLERAGVRRMSAAKARSGEKGFLVETDRLAALKLAASLMKEDDLLLVAGKGHETVQVIGSESKPFDDREQVRIALETKSEG